MLALNIALLSMAWNGINGRIERGENRIEQVQAQYGRITSVDIELTNQSERLERIERLLDQLREAP